MWHFLFGYDIVYFNFSTQSGGSNLQFVLLIAGLALIIKSADILIDSVAKIARLYGVSSFIIGITVIAFGTSAPELAVGIISGISKTNQLTLGNVIGSSMTNIALIVGIASVFYPLQVKDTIVKRELPMLIFVEIALGLMILLGGRLTRLEGGILLLGFAAFMIYITRSAAVSMKIRIDPEGDIDTDRDNNGLSPERIMNENERPQQQAFLKLCVFSVLALVGLGIGGKLTVSSSSNIALSFGLSKTLIGLTVVALATSMPELVTSIIAVRKKEPDIVLGNCIGSILFNILLVLGTSTVISPITGDAGIVFDIAAMLTVTTFIFLVSRLRRRLYRITGIIFLMGYSAYLTIKIITALGI